MAGPTLSRRGVGELGSEGGSWDDSFGLLTLGAIYPLIEAVEVGPGVRVLDIACDTGSLAPNMIAEASRRHSGIDFRVLVGCGH